MYEFKNNGYIRAQVGDSPTVRFTVKPPLGVNTEHTLKTVDGREVTKRFYVRDNTIIFENVKMEDGGVYIVSCTNKFGTGEYGIKLDIADTLGKSIHTYRQASI